VTHTIFATHFGRPLPRWADEGACTSVEHVSEKAKQQQLLISFLTTGRGIAFNQLFAMSEYPRDVLPLYSQGFSLARFLIAQKGRQEFVKYVGDGMNSGDWGRATQSHYGYKDLSELQLTWLDWVRRAVRPSRRQIRCSHSRLRLPRLRRPIRHWCRSALQYRQVTRPTRRRPRPRRRLPKSPLPARLRPVAGTRVCETRRWSRTPAAPRPRGRMCKSERRPRWPKRRARSLARCRWKDRVSKSWNGRGPIRDPPLVSTGPRHGDRAAPTASLAPAPGGTMLR